MQDDRSLCVAFGLCYNRAHDRNIQSVSDDLSQRAGTLLRTLVALHIRDGQPVGSRTLREEAGLPVSPATIRNAMSELEELGFLRSPHTSIRSCRCAKIQLPKPCWP